MYNTRLRKSRNWNDGTEKTISLNRNNEGMMNATEIKKISNKILQKAKKENKNIELMILGRPIHGGLVLLKSFESDIDVMDEDDYLKGRVLNEAKFNDFFNLN